VKRRLLALLLPPLGALLIRLIYLSCRKEFHTSSMPEEPCIVAFWHGELLMMPYLYKRLRGSHPIAVMISEHFDGELIARTIASFGFESIRGSSKRGGAKVLIQALKKMQKGYDIAITPDGPRGPRHSVAPGIVLLAQKSGAKIVPFSYEASSYWQLKSWDGFVIPKPFCTLRFYAGAPFGLEGMEMEEAKDYVKKQMLQYHKS